MSESTVAAAAEQSPNLAGLVIMIDRETLAGAARQLADTTDTALLRKKRVVFSGRQSVPRPQHTVTVDLLPPTLPLSFRQAPRLVSTNQRGTRFPRQFDR